MTIADALWQVWATTVTAYVGYFSCATSVLEMGLGFVQAVCSMGLPLMVLVQICALFFVAWKIVRLAVYLLQLVGSWCWCHRKAPSPGPSACPTLVELLDELDTLITQGTKWVAIVFVLAVGITFSDVVSQPFFILVQYLAAWGLLISFGLALKNQLFGVAKHVVDDACEVAQAVAGSFVCCWGCRPAEKGKPVSSVPTLFEKLSVRLVVHPIRAPAIFVYVLTVSSAAGIMAPFDLFLCLLFQRSTGVSKWFALYAWQIAAGPTLWLNAAGDQPGDHRRQGRLPYYFDLRVWFAGFFDFPPLDCLQAIAACFGYGTPAAGPKGADAVVEIQVPGSPSSAAGVEM